MSRLIGLVGPDEFPDHRSPPRRQGSGSGFRLQHAGQVLRIAAGRERVELIPVAHAPLVRTLAEAIEALTAARTIPG